MVADRRRYYWLVDLIPVSSSSSSSMRDASFFTDWGLHPWNAWEPKVMFMEEFGFFFYSPVRSIPECEEEAEFAILTRVVRRTSYSSVSEPMGFWQTSSENKSSLHEELNHPKTSSSFWPFVGIMHDTCEVVGKTELMPSKNRNPTMG